MIGGLATMLVACDRRPRASHPVARSALMIAVVGDSLALGVGAERPEDGFVFRAVHMLERDGYAIELFNTAIVSATVADTLRLEVPRVRKRLYDIMIVCVGSNDLANDIDPADFAIEYDQLLQALRPSAATLICCGVPEVGLVRGLTTEQRRAASVVLREYNASVVSLTARVRGRFVDLVPLGKVPSDGSLSIDGLHPSSRAYAMMAARLTAALLRVSRAQR